MSARRITPQALSWFGVFAAPAAWTLQHVFGMGVTLAACSSAGATWHVGVDTITIVLTAVAAAVCALGCVAAFLSFRGVRGAGNYDPPPRGRTFFLAVIGMTVSPLLLAIVLMTGSGVVSLTPCSQS